MSRKKIDAPRATPQASRSLRVGSKGFGRALRAKAEGKEPPAEEPDDDEDDDREDAITSETQDVVASRQTPAGITRIVRTRHGFVMAAAGVDASNIEAGTVVLLPEDPDGDARRLRSDERTRDLPIIMLTARSEEHDKIAGLEAGADDYLSKPFSPRELLARIKAVLRRRAPQMTEDSVEVEGLRVDPLTHRVSGNGRTLDLGPTEFRLRHFFMTHPERVHSRALLLDRVWGDHIFVEERTVDVHIRRLRAALEASGHDRLIQTVRGSGYRFSALGE